jgi:hypothetical protein
MLVTDTGKPRNQRSLPKSSEEPACANAKCHRCGGLENEYQRSLAEISFVVSKRFSIPPEKLRELHKWQDIRDDAVKALYRHKASHKRDRGLSALD